MSQIQVEVPQEIAKSFSHKRTVSYQDIIDNYENSFEYESVDVEANEFKEFLVTELSHD